MSALDMVLQRQVPARLVAKSGEGATGGDAAGDSRNDAFSAALSQEKRSAAAEPDKTASSNETDTGAETADSEDQLASDSAQSDDVLNLLAGLRSSAAYSEDAELGKASQNEAPAAVPGAAPAVASDDEAAEALLAEKAGAARAEVSDKAAADVAVAARLKAAAAQGAQAKAQTDAAAVNSSASAADAQETANAADAQKAAAVRAGGPRTEQLTPAETVKSPSTSPAPTATATPATLVGAAGAAGQGAQAPVKAPTAESGGDRQKDQAAIKEVMRALGMDGEAKPVEEARVRGRNAGSQADTADRRSDNTSTPKGGKVEVIETRRFMPAQNMSANAQLVTRSLVEAGNAAVATQRATPAQPVAQTGQTLHTLKLQLNPVSLGSVTAVLKLAGDELSVEIKVQTAEAFRQIKQDNESILKALRGQGFGVEQITVQHVTGSERASNQTAQQGFQPSQQGPGSNDAQSSGSESGRNNARQQDSGSRGGQGHEQGSYAGPGTGRTDGVYL